ncbi:hypothetical protein AVEN_77710-1 [Araneus ventricosus]|uniref:Uncharacterized protein n=1 Tax=Araneus ventricosus TaxID=182803 RepID=A0A4Y2KWS8_ARAVE|nr:hypothetical protein AVEN_77710-1 [Araneus ventricosus]
MVSFDDVWRPIERPWLSPYHYPSGIVLDVKSRLIPTALVSNCDVHGPNATMLTCTGDNGAQTTGRRANSRPSCSQRDTVWRDMDLSEQRAATPAVALLVSSGIWHIATGSDHLPLW